jgi:endo-1,4-beta-xylanase
MQTIPQPRHQLLHSALLSAVVLCLATPHTSAAQPALKEVFHSDFLIGAALNRSHVSPPGLSAGNPQRVEAQVALVLHHFNQITAENDMKWQLIHPREGADGYDFAPADAFVDFGTQHGMHVAGHTLVWHSQTPNWVFAGTNPPPPDPDAAAPSTNQPPRRNRPPGRAYSGPRASRDQLLQRMRDHIHTVVGRYKGRVKTWDVVNEAIADGPGTNVLRNSLWLQIIGPDYIAKAFQFAHEADPDAVLRYNDYGLEDPRKRRKLLELIRSLQAQQVPIHAIGSQAHLNVSIRPDSMDLALAEMKTLGLPIHITELDINGAVAGQQQTGADISANAAATAGGLVSDADRRLADAYAGVFRAFRKHRDAVTMVTFWGVNDAVSWRRNGKPLPFDDQSQPKPAFHAIVAEAAASPAPPPSPPTDP